MPAQFSVLISPKAFADLEEILEFVARDSPANAVRLIDYLLEQVQSLEQFPGRYALLKSTAVGRTPLRLMPAPPFRILYQLDSPNQVVRVLAVEHGARNRPH